MIVQQQNIIYKNANYRYDDLSTKYVKLQKDIYEMTRLKENTPEDCKLGPWCRGCTYAKKYEVFITTSDTVKMNYCGKDEACKQFIQRSTYDLP